MSVKVVTKPAAEPVTLDEAKNALKIDTSPPTTHPDDNYIQNILIPAARVWCEKAHNHSFITQTLELTLDRFPRRRDPIELPHAPLQSVVSLIYKASDGTTETVSFLDPSGDPLLETDDYIVDTSEEPGRLCLKDGSYWPATVPEAKAIVIQYKVGFGDAADVPGFVRAAILIKIADMYENRGDSDPGVYERAAKSLLFPDRIWPI